MQKRPKVYLNMCCCALMKATFAMFLCLIPNDSSALLLLLDVADNLNLVKAILCAGLYPNVAKIAPPTKG